MYVWILLQYEIRCTFDWFCADKQVNEEHKKEHQYNWELFCTLIAPHNIFCVIQIIMTIQIVILKSFKGYVATNLK